jgi:NAD-dependent dihydropyrimidine dehydrogenase PreA subunit
MGLGQDEKSPVLKACMVKERAMARKITDACVNCGACEGECPVEAISEKNSARWIDPDKCIDCGACESACPTEAIVAG